jgi:carbonic anhydrase/acetyltransferase-like protein (isoleucine patch superfamily)
MVMLHGCSIGDGSLIGIRSVVLNHAQIGRQCLIGANTLITEGKVIPDRSLVMGSPGKIIRQLTDDEVAHVLENANHYVQHFKTYREQFKPQSS